MTRRAAAALLAAALLVLPSVGAAPIDRVPTSLPEDARTYRSALGNASDAEGIDAIRAAVGEARQVAPRVVPHLVDLGGSDGDLLAELWGALRDEARAGNATNARSLAGAAVDTLDDPLIARADAWDRNRTTVTPGRAAGDRVPVVLIHPPPAGLGAFEIRVAADAPVQPTEATVAIGQGQTRLDPDNGSAALASFDARALAGLGGGSRQVVTLGHVTFPADAGTIPVQVEVVELVDPDGRPLPAVSPTGEVEIASAGLLEVPANVLALGLVAALGIGAVVAVRRVVRL